MNAKKARAARRAAPPVHSQEQRGSFWTSWKGITIGAAVIAVIAGSFVLPGIVSSDSSANPHAGMAMGVGVGEGLTAGTPVPSFSEKDVVTGSAISSKSLSQGKTLLFFSEGVMCQACFQQIKGIEEVGAKLSERGIRLISITPDSKDELQKAIAQYDIRTPMISDSDRNMSAAFNTLGKGMHGDTPGHAFVLMSHGKVLWYRDYWLPPTRAMYVEPQKILADMPAA
jgi:peroxiredoxin